MIARPSDETPSSIVITDIVADDERRIEDIYRYGERRVLRKMRAARACAKAQMSQYGKNARAA